TLPLADAGRALVAAPFSASTAGAVGSADGYIVLGSGSGGGASFGANAAGGVRGVVPATPPAGGGGGGGGGGAFGADGGHSPRRAFEGRLAPLSVRGPPGAPRGSLEHDPSSPSSIEGATGAAASPQPSASTGK